MIYSKKGVESFPFFLFLSLLIVAVVLSIGFYQIRAFSEFSAKRDITDSYNNIVSAMENLRSTADYGSFTRIRLKIGAGYNITISEDDTIFIKGPDMNLNNSPGFNILGITDRYKNLQNEYTFEKGEYELVVYYGDCTEKTKEALQVCFV